MAEVKIRVCSAEDAEYVADNLRKTDVAEIVAAHGTASLRDLIVASATASDLAHVATLDGRPVCVFGATCVAPGVASPWLLATEEWSDVPKRAVVWFSGVYLQMMREGHTLLFNYVYAHNVVAMAWIKHLGFNFSVEPVPHGKYGEPFHLFWIGGVSGV